MANSKKAARAVDAQGLLKHLHYFLENHLPPKADVTLGLSGGLDSCVLLHLLAQLRQPLDFQLSAIHVNHQISPNACEWSRFCEKLCTDMGVPLKVVEVDVPRNSGLGLEAAAREARYGALLEHGSGMLALAHHQDDQAETMLLQLLRGAGVDGLSAMAALREMAATRVLRPLLGVSRLVLFTYASNNHLGWVEDESNSDTRYDRNYLRKKVMPVIESRFPSYRVNLARSMENLADAARLLHQVAQQDANLLMVDSKLDLPGLKLLSPERAMNLLRWWLQNEAGINPGRAWMQNALHQLLNAGDSATVACVIGGITIRRYRNYAYIDCSAVSSFKLSWNGKDTLCLPDGSQLKSKMAINEGIPLSLCEQGLVVTNRSNAPDHWKLALKTHEKRPSRSMKNLWQEAGIPPWERDHTPLIWHNGVLVAVPGIGISNSLPKMQDEPCVQIEWIRSIVL